MHPTPTGRSALARLRTLPPSVRTVVALTIAFTSLTTAANETDQFLLPTDKPFADVGPLISSAHYSVLVTVTDKLNKKIRRAQDIGDPERRRARLESLHSPRLLADMVRYEFGPGFFETLGVESLLKKQTARRVYPDDTYLSFQRPDWIYSFAHLPVDPRNLPLLVPSSTIRVYDHYIGTDKLGHFHDLGHYYFRDYTRKVDAGKDEEEAIDEIVRAYSRGIISEKAIIGFVATGVYSNADLVSNYMGFRFYQNLTEPVMLQGREFPALLVLVGGYWKLNTHVRPDSDFMAPFFSDHWNEALNPCVYEWGLRNAIRRKLRDRAGEVLDFYCGPDERPRDPHYFTQLAQELSTYYGEDYGYRGDPAEAMGIATACFDGVSEPTEAVAAHPPAPSGSAPGQAEAAAADPRASTPAPAFASQAPRPASRGPALWPKTDD